MKVCVHLICSTLLIGLSFVMDLSAQTSLSLEVSTGIESGIWIYERGTDDPAFDNNQGYDRTHIAMMLPAEIGLILNHGRWKFGLQSIFRVLTDDQMIRQEDKPSRRDRYPVADGWVPFWQYGGSLAYALIHGQGYTFSPELSAGGFQIDTTHPREDDFGLKYYVRFALLNEFRLSNRLEMLLRAHYTIQTILPQNPLFAKEQHKIRAMGLHIGLRYHFWQKKGD